MKTILNLPSGQYDAVITHLLPRRSSLEEAAFLFATAAHGDDVVTFDVQAMELLSRDDFEVQETDYLELLDETRARLIKRAHDLGTCLVEMHSHPGPLPAAFSVADRIGLGETVPHMWWRLSKRPYLAIVVARSGFDALVWLEGPKTPQALDALMAGHRLLKPTNLSLQYYS
jgi:hypothetical protein